MTVKRTETNAAALCLYPFADGPHSTSLSLLAFLRWLNSNK